MAESKSASKPGSKPRTGAGAEAAAKPSSPPGVVASGLKFEVYRDNDKRYRWRLRAANGEPIASGEAYKVGAKCLHAVELIRQGAVSAEVEIGYGRKKNPPVGPPE